MIRFLAGFISGMTIGVIITPAWAWHALYLIAIAILAGAYFL